MRNNDEPIKDNIDSGEVAGGAAGAIGGGLAGAAVGGPVGGLIGAMLGAAAGSKGAEALEGNHAGPDANMDAGGVGSTGEPEALASNELMGSGAKPIGPAAEGALEGERIEEEVTGDLPGKIERPEDGSDTEANLTDDPITDPYANGETGYADIQDRRI